jgi:outer membrane biosynthesis protein TonB
MRRVKVVLVAAMVIPLAGCVFGGKPKAVAAAPAPPKPASPPEPLSIPQTRVDLPAPQPVKPEALNTAPREEPPPPVEPKPIPAPRRPPAPQPKTVEQPPAEPARLPIQEILPADEKNRLTASVQRHRAEIGTLVARAQKSHLLTANQKNMLEKIRQFVTQSEQAENSSDMRSADEFAEKANILAKELQSGK